MQNATALFPRLDSDRPSCTIWRHARTAGERLWTPQLSRGRRGRPPGSGRHFLPAVAAGEGGEGTFLQQPAWLREAAGRSRQQYSVLRR